MGYIQLTSLNSINNNLGDSDEKIRRKEIITVLLSCYGHALPFSYPSLAVVAECVKMSACSFFKKNIHLQMDYFTDEKKKFLIVY